MTVSSRDSCRVELELSPFSLLLLLRPLISRLLLLVLASHPLSLVLVLLPFEADEEENFGEMLLFALIQNDVVVLLLVPVDSDDLLLRDSFLFN